MRELVLHAREQRYAIRKSIADRNLASLSFTLNIPGYPKSTALITEVFSRILGELVRFLTAHRVFVRREWEMRLKDEAGDFYIVPLEDLRLQTLRLEEVKTVTERFEESHALGRLVDIDVTDRDFQPISSGKAKGCFICETVPAMQCMRQNTHEKEQLRDVVRKRMQTFLAQRRRSDLCRDLSQWALKALLYEISLTPKPGAVDRVNCGSHSDMDYITFLNSSSVLAGYFSDLSAAGFDFCGEPGDVLPAVRCIGLEMEERMFRETGGVNTQKGTIFLVGLTLFSAASVVAETGHFNRMEFINRLKLYTAGLTETELNPSKPRTHGETCAVRYGTQLGGGIRYEAEKGLPTVFEYGLPALKRRWGNGANPTREKELKEPLIYTLLSLMAHADDANILYRKGPDQLQRIKSLARRAATAMEKPAGNQWEKEYRALMDYCLMENLSPGGSSDLLVITILLYFIEEHYGL